MKPDDVSTMQPETGNCHMTSSLDSNKTDDKRNMTSTLGMLKQGKNVTQTNPTRAPPEMTNAIRRRKQTSDLDYWHTIPPGSQMPKPLYRAVLRGTLAGGSAVCTLSSMADAANEKDYNMIIRRSSLVNGFHGNGNGNQFHRQTSVIRAEDMGLTVSGLSISEARTKHTSNMASPRNNLCKVQTIHNNKQRKLTTQNNSKNINASNNNNDSNGVDHDAPFKSDNRSKPKANGQSTLNPKPAQRSPRPSLTTRTSIGDLADRKRRPISPRSEYAKRNASTSLDLSKPFSPHRNALIRQTSLPVTSNNSKIAPDINVNTNTSGSHSNPMETTLAKRKFSQEIDNCKKISSQNSPSAAIQFADSILNAVKADLNQVYSICQAKVRYAEFIEDTQPHRLGEQSLPDPNRTKDISSPHDYDRNGNSASNYKNNDLCLSKNQTKELSSVFSSPLSSSSSSSSPSSNLSPKPVMSRTSTNINKTSPSLPLRLAPLATKPNKYITLRDPSKEGDLPFDKPVTIILDSNRDSTRTKITRPILKSSKTDIDTNLPSFRQCGDKADSNNNSSIGNRLVRFKVNHEIREFAPSEPVRYF